MQMVTAAEMAAIDRRTAEEFGTPFGELMENAGTAVAAFVRSHYSRARRVAVLCGTGNNGGDGFVAARSLLNAGVQVAVVLAGDEAKLKGAAADAFGLLDRSAIAVTVLADETQAAELRALLNGVDVVIDAVLGTGFKPPLRGLAAALRDGLHETSMPVVAIDVPSGWDADSRDEKVEGSFRADAVVTFTAPKPAHLFGHLTSATLGPVVVAAIGTPEQAIVSQERIVWTGSSKRIFEAPREIDSNKGMYGHVLVVGGAAGKPGAPSMASLAALRMGAGLVTAAVAQSILETVALITPELMTVPLEECPDGSVAVANAWEESRERLLKKISVLAIGPGLGTEGETPEFVRKLVAETTLPVVVDADGLNAFKGRAELLQGHGRTMVLTPHPGEMGTLLGISTKEVQSDRLNLARKFATEHGLTLVLKGWRTLVAHPDGTVAVNTTGNPAMAKGGSGDILTGIVAAALAQHPDRVAEAVNAAVYLHGLAADFAAVRRDEHTVLATDTVAHLSEAFRYRTREDGVEWVCGVRRKRWGGPRD